MYADDTTIYVTGSDPDLVISALNKVLEKFYEWRCKNLLIPNSTETEFMLLGGDRFVRPLQGIKLDNFYIKRVSSSRCLGIEIDHLLKWNIHVTELFKLLFSQKLNLLKSLYFLPTNERLQFYSKVKLLSITYGLLIWGSCGKTLFNELKRIHIREPKIIYGLDCQTPSDVVLRETKWTTLEKMYSQRLLVFVFKCYNGYHPESLEAQFTKYASQF
jgi:hypothetical protein